MIDLLKEIFGYFADITVKMMNTQSSILLFLAMMIWLLSDIMHCIGKALKVGDDDDNINS